MTTPTTTKPKRRRKPTARKRTTNPISDDGGEPSFFAHALTVQGRFTLAWLLLCAAVRILIKGRALV
jgi:hypothetical protein